MARRKILFVIVEGPSDEEALGLALSRIFDRHAVYLHVMHTDITTKSGVTASNIVDAVKRVIQTYTKGNHYDKVHFEGIIHITDTDGAFIPEAAVVADNTQSTHFYTPSSIQTPSRNDILLRNNQKSQNLNKLYSYDSIWGIPYRLYYMSCNLDHVLYDKMNSTDAQKEADAYAFSKSYKDNLPAFVEFILSPSFLIGNDYNETWALIKKDLNSLGRHTNLGLCFPNASPSASSTA